MAPCVAKAAGRTPISTIGHRLGTDFEAELRKLFAPESLGMNVTTKPLDALLSVSSLGNSAPKAPSIQGGGFLDAMKQALSTTSQLQSESGRLSREVTLGNPTQQVLIDVATALLRSALFSALRSKRLTSSRAPVRSAIGLFSGHSKTKVKNAGRCRSLSVRSLWLISTRHFYDWNWPVRTFDH